MSVADNINLSSLDEAAIRGLIQPREYRRRAGAMIEALSIKTPSTETLVRYLSGGNQQKTVIARWLATDTQVFVLEEPGLGVDVGAKIEIYTLINRMAAAGSAVFIISTDIPELLGISDRVMVMYRGRVTKELAAAEATPETVLFWSTGGGANGDEAAGPGPRAVGADEADTTGAAP
jgi:ribose transport system ATP-binding protein